MVIRGWWSEKWGDVSQRVQAAKLQLDIKNNFMRPTVALVRSLSEGT